MQYILEEAGGRDPPPPSTYVGWDIPFRPPPPPFSGLKPLFSRHFHEVLLWWLLLLTVVDYVYTYVNVQRRTLLKLARRIYRYFILQCFWIWKFTIVCVLTWNMPTGLRLIWLYMNDNEELDKTVMEPIGYTDLNVSMRIYFLQCMHTTSFLNYTTIGMILLSIHMLKIPRAIWRENFGWPRFVEFNGSSFT